MIAATPSSTDCRREPQNARATTLPTDNIINGNGLIQLLGPESATISGARTLDETHRTAAGAREERLRQERVAACSEFAAAVTSLKTGVVAAWLRRADPDAYPAAQAEAGASGG